MGIYDKPPPTSREILEGANQRLLVRGVVARNDELTEALYDLAFEPKQGWYAFEVIQVLKGLSECGQRLGEWLEDPQHLKDSEKQPSLL